MKFSSIEEIHNHALKLRGVKQADLIKQLNFKDQGHKNHMGDLFEAWFGKEKDSASMPDLGIVELKATPFKELKKKRNGKIQHSVKERLVLNIINYMDIVKETDFEHSHLLMKNRVLEIGFYEFEPDLPPDEWMFKYIVLYQMAKNPVDYAVIKKDWEIIQSYVKEGRAEELSESLTDYLSACTKGKNRNSLREQPFSSVKAMQRAFSFKTKYMNSLFHSVEGSDDVESNEALIKDPLDIPNLTSNPEQTSNKSAVESVVLSRLNGYIGKSQKELMEKFNLTGKKAKNINEMLVRRMLGMQKDGSLNDIPEFDISSIMPKTIVFDTKGHNKESMSFPAFEFQNLVDETWVDEDGKPSAQLHCMCSETKFLFIVFQQNQNDDLIFKGCRFYTMPPKLIEGPIKDGWNDTRRKLREGVLLKNMNPEGQKPRIVNNFIGQADNPVIHVRPHATKTSYSDTRNASKLPAKARWTNKPSGNDFTDEYMTKQCFWLNAKFVRNIVADLCD